MLFVTVLWMGLTSCKFTEDATTEGALKLGEGKETRIRGATILLSTTQLSTDISTTDPDPTDGGFIPPPEGGEGGGGP